MTRSRWLLLLATLVVLAVAAAAAWVTFADDGSGPSEAALTTADAAEALARAGVAEVRVSLNVEMPPEFDDGVPAREFEGEGLADFAGNLAEVEYGMGEVPNSAGFFGHVDGDLTVVYEGSRFVLTFPIMADVLEGDLEWMSYRLSDFSHPKILAAGIGQLREIGLADPRIGFALASSGLGGEPDANGRLPIDLAQAQAEVAPEAQRALQELQGLGVQQVLLGIEVDEEGLLRAYSYELAYPPGGSGGRDAQVSITVEITETGADGSVEVPPEPAVESYLDYANVQQT